MNQKCAFKEAKDCQCNYVIFIAIHNLNFDKTLKIIFYSKKFQIEPLTVEIPANGSNTVQCKICWDT